MSGSSMRKRLSMGEKGEVANDKTSGCDKVDEIGHLRELNQRLINDIIRLRQENASLFSDKTNLEANVLQLKNEKIELESELIESKARTGDLLEKIEDSTHLWDSERRKWEGIVSDLQTRLDFMVSERDLLSQKNRELSTGAETLNAQLNVLEFELNASKGRTGELQGKIEDDQRLWNEEKRNMENSLAVLQNNLESMASEVGSLNQNNRELSSEVEFLKIQVKEYNDKLVCMEDEKMLLKEISASDAERLETLVAKNAAMEDNINELQQKVKEGVKQYSDSIEQYKAIEHVLIHQNKILQEQVDSARCLLETQNLRCKQSIVENDRLDKQVEESNKSFEGLYDTHIKQVQEKKEQTIQFESLVSKKYTELEERYIDLLKEKEEQGKTIETLQRENASLVSEKSLPLQRLDEGTKNSEDISEKCLHDDQKVLELESQSSRLHTELAAANLACDETTIQLNKIKEDMNKLSNNSCQIQEEKESLHEKLMIEISRTKALEEELLSSKCTLEEMKESASKGEQQIANLRSQILASHEFFDTQSQFMAMKDEERNLLADLQDQFPSPAAEKRFTGEENTSLQIELDRRTLASEEEQVKFNGRVREMETKEAESQLVDLQYQLSDLAEAKKDLEDKLSDVAEAKNDVEEKNNSLMSELKQPLQVKSRVIPNGRQSFLEEENTSLQIGLDRRTMASVNSNDIVRELDTKEAESQSVETISDVAEANKEVKEKNKYSRSKVRQPLQVRSPVIQNGKQNNSLVTEVKSKVKHPLQLKSPAIQNGKQKSVGENGKQKSVDENGKPRGLHERPKPKGVQESGKENRVMETSTPKKLIEKARRVQENGKENGVVVMGTRRQSVNRTNRWVP